MNNFPKINVNSLVINDSNAFAINNKIIYPKDSKISYYSQDTQKAKLKLGKFFELILFGLNYNAKRIKYFRKPWVLDLQKSHKILIDEKRQGEIKTKIFKRRLLFFSQNSSLVTELAKLLKTARRQNSYSGHGLIARNDHYKTKPGKIRQK